uniref:Uncharacterized protein n=1 Tax=Lepeophtheirus salmonis TaxID=72036 RepID=A0A0K2T713_LEPSM
MTNASFDSPFNETFNASVPNWHRSGGLPMISDSAFSLIILIYVSIPFLCMFFLFCWKTAETEDENKLGQSNCPLMTNQETDSLQVPMIDNLEEPEVMTSV